MPSSKNYKRNYKQEYANQGGTPARRKARSKNTMARRKAIKEGKVKKGSTKDVAHTKPKANGSTFIQSRSKNRSIPRTKTAKRRSK